MEKELISCIIPSGAGKLPVSRKVMKGRKREPFAVVSQFEFRR